MTVWYLVFSGLVSFLGPMGHEECLNARKTFPSAECREVHVWRLCSYDRKTPGTVLVCPDFSDAPVSGK